MYCLKLAGAAAVLMVSLAGLPGQAVLPAYAAGPGDGLPAQPAAPSARTAETGTSGTSEAEYGSAEAALLQEQALPGRQLPV